MNSSIPRLTLAQCEARHAELLAAGHQEPWYGGPLSRHVLLEGDHRLRQLRFDPSAASMRLWNFLLTENQRLREARAAGEKLVGAMKDLGTVPVMAYSLTRTRAFYPDGAWWTPCLMECTDGLLRNAAAMGIDDSYCPVRAMLPAFHCNEHFPRPDLLLCSTGAVCDDFSAIAQRLQHTGVPVQWWEMPRRRVPDAEEEGTELPGGQFAPESQVQCVRAELVRLKDFLEGLTGQTLGCDSLVAGIRSANEVRALLLQLRSVVYQAEAAPLPGLEMLIAEMLAIHFCSDLQECKAVLRGLLDEAQERVVQGDAVLRSRAVRVYWVNPVSDLRAMNCLEEWGGRVCGSDYMFTHALDLIPTDVEPLRALALTALADPMVGSAKDRAARIVRECRACEAEAVVVSRIPGASHCAYEGASIREAIHDCLDIPVVELEIPSICDAMLPTIASRMQALLETAARKREGRV